MADAFMFFGGLLGSLWIIGYFIEKKRDAEERNWNEKNR